MYKKKDMNIESYDGKDAFYSGTDEEYEEFLKNADIKINEGEDAEPVENTQRVNLNETINLQNVIDRFKKTAGDIGSGAKTLKDTVVGKMDMFKSKKEETEDEDKAETTESDSVTEKAKSADGSALAETKAKFADIYKDITSLSSKLDAISSKLDASAARGKEDMKDLDGNYSDIMTSVNSASADILEIKQAINSV